MAGKKDPPPSNIPEIPSRGALAARDADKNCWLGFVRERLLARLMKLEHVAIYTKDLEALKSFYEKYFQARSNDVYVNPKKRFRSYFLSFADGARLELMQKESVPCSLNDPIAEATGIIHIAFSLGSQNAVNRMAEQLREDGFRILDGPRRTGDGYYECAFLDPDGNRIEITE